MRILAIDSSAFPASAAITDNGKIIAEFYIHTKFTHSQTLMPMIKSVLDMSQTEIKDLDLVAATMGPGSFTGVRIGVASAKGIAMPFSIPCAGISALEAIAYNFNSDSDDKLICASMDARVGQVYNALFRVSGGKIHRITPDRVIQLTALAEEMKEYNEKIYLAGDGAELCFNAFADINCVVVPENLRYQRASAVAFAAAELMAEGKTCTAAELQPLYLQIPQATRELNRRLNNK